MKRRSVWLASFVLVGGCGGPEFSTALADPAASGAQPEQSDARPTAPDGPDGSAASGGDSASDAGASTPDAASGDSASDTDASADPAGEGGHVEDAPGTDAGPSDATADAGDAEAGLDAGVGDTDSGVQDGDAGADADACDPALYFLDGDGDGYGGTTSWKGCRPPDSGTWVAMGGDCDDSNPSVSPGQSAYFAVGYVPTGKSDVSFDYNCDAQESESGGPAKGSCHTVSLSCVGSGYVEASPVRSGAGVDPFCGSAQAVTCAVTSLVCKAGAPYTVSPIACH